MPILTRCEFLLGDTLVGYQAPEHDRNAVGLCLLPAAMASAMAIPREHLDAPAVANLPASWLPVRRGRWIRWAMSIGSTFLGFPRSLGA